MAPGKPPTGEITLYDALDSIGSGAVKARGTGLDDLIFLLDRNSRAANLSELGDKHYHRVFESLFKCVIAEKQSYFGGKKTTAAAAATRLAKSAEALRLSLSHGASKLKRKTVQAVIDHVTQTLPAPGGGEGYVDPLLQDYIKSLVALLSHQANVEHMSTSSAETWLACVDFCLRCLSRHFESAGADSGPRGSPAPGTTQTFSYAYSTGRSSVNASQKQPGQLSRGTLQDLLHCLYLLVTPANAPLATRSQQTCAALLRVLQLRQLGLSQITHYAFASLNVIMFSVGADDISLVQSLARDLVPFITHWWQGRSVSKDEMLNSVRDEMLKTFFAIHLHLEHLVRNSHDPSVLADMEDLADILWTEYARRNDRAQLHLDDLTLSGPGKYFPLHSIGLRPHHHEGERKWAFVQNLALLERIISLAKGSSPTAESPTEDGEQSKKKRRTKSDITGRLRIRLKSQSTTVLALQLITFLLELDASPEHLPAMLELHPDVVSLIGGTAGTAAASWAMLACASYLIEEREWQVSLQWKVVWHMAVRAVTLPATCRAACHLLQAVLESSILPYHSISDEINSIVTTADVNGPAMLVDSSIKLMSRLFLVRNVKIPSANQQTSHHVIRWTFLRWTPADFTYTSLHSIHVQPIGLANLIKQCYGITPLYPAVQPRVSGGSIFQAWNVHLEMATATRYLLLLSDPGAPSKPPKSLNEVYGTKEHVGLSDPVSSHASKRLVLELLYPKMEELQRLCDSWTKTSSEGRTRVSPEKMQSLICACLIAAMLMPQLEDLNTRLSRDLETTITELCDSALGAGIDAAENHALPDLLLTLVSSQLPSLKTTTIQSLLKDEPCVLRLYAKLAGSLRERRARESSGQQHDSMDLDDEFESQESRMSIASKTCELSRRDKSLSLAPDAFRRSTATQLFFLEAISKHHDRVGLIPREFLEYLLELSQHDFLLCSVAIIEIFSSDFTVSQADALRIIEKLGEIIGETEFTCCEVAHTTTLEVIRGLHQVWLDDQQDVAACVGDLYHYFVKASLPRNSLSPRSQAALANLLFCLLRSDPHYGTNLGLPSCRTTLLSVLQHGAMVVKHFIAKRLPEIFGFYVLKTHDDVFIDVLDSLPTNPDVIEGIAFRLLVLSELACQWSTLLRRCTYHIFEAPGKIPQCAEYAKICLARVSRAIHLDSPRDLFKIFSPQIFYTWLEEDSIEAMPFRIFDFGSLDDMVQASQAEAVALLIMRGQEDAVVNLANRLDSSPKTLIEQGFARIMAYAIAQDTSTSKSVSETVEGRIRHRLGKELFMDLIYANFVDIVGYLFDIFDQEDPVERYLAKDVNFAHAGVILEEMKAFSHSTVVLPANQQPMFKGKYLLRELFLLCSKTEYELHDLWTPALVVSVARKLFSTIHPALGSLHACSALRKVRVLISLAGPVALQMYPLEMLLHSIRPCVVDPECADDALGMSQYLISKGADHLSQAPSFLAGYALSTLASLRVFLESTHSSTSLESQFKATMGKAQEFHKWFTRYLSQYESRIFADDYQRDSFKTITESASHIRSSGNADIGTHESALLLEILRDGYREAQLLDSASRELALGMLCGEFNVPSSARQDVIGNDETAVQHSGLVWSSCKANALSDEYLSWAGRVVGRSFAASGEIQLDLLRESRLIKCARMAPGPNGSEQGIFALLQRLTMHRNSQTAGLAESALRAVVSEAITQRDHVLVTTAQKTLSEPLYLASAWDAYRTPLSDDSAFEAELSLQSFSREQIEQLGWAQDLAACLAQAATQCVLLCKILPLVADNGGVARDALPFIIHLALHSQVDRQQAVKRYLSDAIKGWFAINTEKARDNQKHIVNTLLYLRTQKYPNESSIADRANWLDVEYSLAATAAAACGMHKTALLFTELASTSTTRMSRRSSAMRAAEDSTDLLLSIFENIDDPDAYYGVPKASSLSTILAQLEYENDGSKGLAFRGAQYDSHIRSRDAASQFDGLSLAKSLSTLGLSGLSHSVLQAHQNLEESTDFLDNTYHTARRLEIWNLPASGSSNSHAVTIYKAFQSIHQATDLAAVRSAIYDGLGRTMRNLTGLNLNAANLRRHLGALAVLTELDDVVNLSDFAELETMLGLYEDRSRWMRRGRYDDVSRLLSCRETTLSLLSQHSTLRAWANLSVSQARQIEIRCKLMSSGIYRFHGAIQESLNLSTSLTNLVNSTEDLGLSVKAAISIESANSLWDHGEMISSIRLLQSMDDAATLKRQTIPVSRSDLLSRIGHRVSVARLEKPHDIQKQYLEPSLKELKGKSEGKEAGQVFHQFAIFCDEQLQNADGLEDLARLQNLRNRKSDEVMELKSLMTTTRDSQMKSRYSSHLARAQQWLQLDEQELRRVEQTRAEFVRLSLENYLLSLIASDEHNNDALRFAALWLKQSNDDMTNDAVHKHLGKVPTRKFASLINQLTSRLQDQPILFQKLLMQLVFDICAEHPYHGMYQIWSGVKQRTNTKDEVAVLRQKATKTLSEQLEKDHKVGHIWHAIDRTSGYYHRLAADRDNPKYKAGHKIALKETTAGNYLVNALNKYQIPPPTLQLELAADGDYSKVPIIAKLEPQMSIASGVSAPKIITAVGSDGIRYKQLVKGGNDDLRQDAIMEQVFGAVSSLLKLHRETQQRSLGVRTYKVLPLTSASGLIEFVPNTIPLHEFLMPAHERYFPKDLKGNQCRKEISNVQSKSVETRINTYKKIKDRFHPVMRYFFLEHFVDPDDWFVKRTAYTRTTAAISMLGHVLGLGDRHGHNILLDSNTGEVIHIDLGVAFEMGRVLPVPELVPFRLTRDIEDGMGITATEGVFRRCCEFTLDALREETYSIMTILDVLRYDPLYSWSISPVRLAKLQGARDSEGAEQNEMDATKRKGRTEGGGSRVNEPSEADRALEVVRKKLSKTLSVTATVNDLINQATDERNLAVLYSGWAAYA